MALPALAASHNEIRAVEAKRVSAVVLEGVFNCGLKRGGRATFVPKT